VRRQHVPVGVDEVRAWHRLHAEVLREVTGRIETQRELSRHLGEEFVGQRAILVEIHGDDLQAVGPVLAMHRVQPWKRSPARDAPRRPEVDPDHLPFDGREPGRRRRARNGPGAKQRTGEHQRQFPTHEPSLSEDQWQP
jgi:hypothetical protein